MTTRDAPLLTQLQVGGLGTAQGMIGRWVAEANFRVPDLIRVNDALIWRGPGTTREGSTAGMLDELIKLRNAPDARIERFARQWGPLAFKRRSEPNGDYRDDGEGPDPRPRVGNDYTSEPWFREVASQAVESGHLTDNDLDFVLESTEEWRLCSRIVGDILQLAIQLMSMRPEAHRRIEDLLALHDYSDDRDLIDADVPWGWFGYPRDEWRVPGVYLYGNRVNSGYELDFSAPRSDWDMTTRRLLDHEVDSKVLIESFTVGALQYGGSFDTDIDWGSHDGLPRLKMKPRGVLHLIALQVLLAIERGYGLAFCDYCDAEIDSDRQPRHDRNKTCGSLACKRANDANRAKRYRQRKRGDV